MILMLSDFTTFFFNFLAAAQNNGIFNQINQTIDLQINFASDTLRVLSYNFVHNLILIYYILIDSYFL
jgi:hypothetical protein